MAGDWIKIEVCLPDKPEVAKIARLLKIDQDAVVGKLVRVWSWADQHTTDGNASGVTETFIDRLAFCDGFSKAMQSVGWLVIEDERIEFPRFDRHGGETGKSRGLTAKRVQRHRDKSNGATVTSALPEKRREEKNKVDRGDQISFDREAANRIAADLFRRAGTDQPDSLPWQVATLVVAGKLPEGLAVDAAQGVRECGAAKPWAYFRKCLAEGCSKRGIELRALLPLVSLPKGFDANPPKANGRVSIPTIKGPHDA